jgi:hypothetical protein
VTASVQVDSAISCCCAYEHTVMSGRGQHAPAVPRPRKESPIVTGQKAGGGLAPSGHRGNKGKENCFSREDGKSTCKLAELGCAIAQAVSRRLPTAAVRGSKPDLGMWDFVMDKSGVGAGFLRERRFPLPIYIPSALHNHLHYHPRLAQ